MKRALIILFVFAASIGLSATTAGAGPILVSTINGCYDCHVYDTPSLEITNSTAFDFTNVVLTLTGYQGLNNGVVQSRNIGTITPDSTRGGNAYVYNWMDGYGGVVQGDLFSYDYDDSYVYYYNPVLTNPVCQPQASIYGYQYCAQVGNFYVTFTADWNGQQIYSQFSPDPNGPFGNAAGVFVGWLGLDPNGWSETAYDAHNNGGPNGVLANIYIGTPAPLATPEPGSLVLLGSGLVAIAARLRRRAR